MFTKRKEKETILSSDESSTHKVKNSNFRVYGDNLLYNTVIIYFMAKKDCPFLEKECQIGKIPAAIKLSCVGPCSIERALDPTSLGHYIVQELLQNAKFC